MQVGLHQFDADTVEWFCVAVNEPGRTRNSLARELCVREDWTGHRGEPCLGSARKALPVLADKLGVSLPAARPAFGGRRDAAPKADYPDVTVSCALADLGEVALEPVSGDADRRRWESMMATHHPQGWRRGPGSQMRYWVSSSVHGRLGGIGFCAASWHQKARDRFIGWSADARAANLSGVVNNHRFLILPGVRVHGLASRALELAADRVASDWESSNGVRPVMAYTYVGPGHGGTCYRAAGWQRCPKRTSGQPPGRESLPVVRTVWMRPLADDWNVVLCAEPARTIRKAPALHMDERTDWAGREYARCTHPDGRVRDRIVRMGRAWLERPGAPVPEIFPARSARKAAYRLLSNAGVTMKHILEPHQATMVERCGLEETVLAIQDTTTVNYDTLVATGGLVNIGGGGGGTQGLVAHVGLAVNEAGRPLGVFSLDATYADEHNEEVASVRWRDGLDRAEELARACPETKVVTVCDREADIWGLFARAESTGSGLLVRARRGAKRRVCLEGGGEADLFDHAATLPRVGSKKVKIGACGGKRARSKRKARIELRAGRVTVLAPKKPENQAGRDEPMELLVVVATETDPPADKEPLHWVLLSTEEAADAQTAKTVVGWYERRWTIEQYFRVLKSGTRIEDRQFDHADDLRKCLAFDVITAVHVFDLERMARDRPNVPANRVVSEDEIAILYVRLMAYGILKARPPPERPPDIRTMVIDIARLAGFHPRNSQPLPGTTMVWKGYVLLREATSTYRALKSMGMIKTD
ncbi:MAG: IS4 family transposase [bacterium]|nr:IS4 family transposase [bacterium]